MYYKLFTILPCLNRLLNSSIVTNYKNNISNLFDLENRINSIYAININIDLIKKEYSHNPIIKD